LEKKNSNSAGKLCNRNWHMLDVLRGSSGRNAFVILEGKIMGKRAKGRPRRMWFDDVRQWTIC